MAAYNDDMLALIQFVVNGTIPRLTASGTVADITDTDVLVTFDGSTLPVPVKVGRQVALDFQSRVGMVKFGSEWCVVVAFNPARDTLIETFTASGTWERPVGAREVLVKVQGGGAAGGGAQATTSGTPSQHSVGSGGGGGAYAEKRYNATDLPTFVTVTRGAGGTGVSAAAGNAGGLSRFGATGDTFKLAAYGGYGGLLAGASTVVFGREGGAGGDTWEGTPDIKVFGSPGHSCFGGDTGLGVSGAGGNAQLGAGATGNSSTGLPTSLAGNAADDFGGGGSGALNGGAASAKAGGAGGRGCVIVETIF